ncbi:MAG: glycoside hydrolase family 31 protein [Clostridiaceae bacterium]|jgi:alpha-glucosidase (family GH31 glycosyl hydrolase)|nr:glycoside hydrolase family 31 protein [Clostridiaceae bacterium]
MKYVLEFDMLEGEQWYGGKIGDGTKMPVDASREYTDNSVGPYGDQSSPFFVSNKGRYIWSEDGYITNFKYGKVKCESDTAEIVLYGGFGTLRGAYLAASKAHFPPDGNMPPELMFQVPQYCTWIEMFKFQSEKGILNYAESILKCGMPAGEILIDDGWQIDFGNWEFKPRRFKDPKGMVEKLHVMGFKVILWVVPFISPRAPAFDYLKKNDLLVKDKSGSVAMRKWWDATSAVLDLSNPRAVEWFVDVAHELEKKYGVDGFKQDAADNRFYKKDDITFGNASPNQQAEFWMRSGLNFTFNEFRASWKGGGVGVAQRLGDKCHRWQENGGLRALIPNMLLLGLTGHVFGCPDMIGGGLVSDFNFRPEFLFDHELFIRWSQCSALMPMMQYSYSLWRCRNQKTAELCRRPTYDHIKYSDYILKYARAARTTGEPIVRFMEYNYPNDPGAAKATQQFMLGEDYIVAPIVRKKTFSREVFLPSGAWKLLHSGETFTGPATITVNIPIEVLPIFEKV